MRWLDKLIFLFLINIQIASADEYLCKIIYKKNDKTFKFLPYSETSKLIELTPLKLIIWVANSKLQIKLTGGEFKKPLSTNYHIDQESIFIKYGDELNLQCLKKVNKKEIAKLPVKNNDLINDQHKFLILRNLSFPYKQLEAIDEMRVLHLQKNKVFKNSQSLQPKTNWCSLQIQITRDEDTIINEKAELIPVNFDKFSNNSQFDSYSFSFVDFSKGKIKGANSRYRPFMLTCNILKNTKFSLQTFNEIAGIFIKPVKI